MSRKQTKLVLTRRVGQAVMVGNDVKVVVLDISSHTVKLHFLAPEDVDIDREEVRARILAGEARSKRRKAS